MFHPVLKDEATITRDAIVGFVPASNMMALIWGMVMKKFLESFQIPPITKIGKHEASFLGIHYESWVIRCLMEKITVL